MKIAPLAYLIKHKDGSTTMLHRGELLAYIHSTRATPAEYLMDTIDSIRYLITHQSVSLAKDPDAFIGHAWLLFEALKIEEKCLDLLSTYLQKEAELSSP